MTHSPSSSRRGVALVNVLLFCMVLLILAGSVLAWAVTERRLSRRAVALIEARNAAEGIAEAGFAQVAQLASTNNVIFSKTLDDQQMFMTGKTKVLKLPDLTFFNGGHVVTSGDLKPEVRAGQITKVTNKGDRDRYYYDRTVNNNSKDSKVVDRWVERRDVRVLAKATVQYPGAAPVTAYVEERISVRGVPLFAAAIFYNMDLEIHPGPDMNIGGPVIVNGNLFVNQQYGNSRTLAFLGPVSVSGDLFHAFKSYTGLVTATSTEPLKSGNVRFLKSGSTTTVTDMYKDAIWHDSTNGVSRSWYDGNGYPKASTISSMAEWNKILKDAADAGLVDFSTFAATEWGSNVQTRVDKTPLPGIPDYREQTASKDKLGTAAVTDDSANSCRAIIEPVLPSTDTNYVEEVENQKFAKKAGLTIVVDPESGAISYKTPGGTNGTTIITPRADVGATAAKLATWNPYSDTGKVTLAGTVTGGLYDQRQQVGQNLVEIDYRVLRKIVTNLDSKTPDTANSIPGLTASSWTGVVYVEVQGGPTTAKDGKTIAATKTSAMTTAVRIRNGKNDPANNLSTPSSGVDHPGLTIATAAPVYILGHFNADGLNNTAASGAITNPDVSPDGYKTEQPAAIVADAVTILSPAWEAGSDVANGKYVTNLDKASNKDNYFGADQNGNPTRLPIATGSEISAAIILGITPTNKNNQDQNSGGAHNALRYLENWQDTVANTVRGSLVSLYESRVATKRFFYGRYYKPPQRNWGWNQLFQDGKFPPGTPLALSFRRGYYREISAAEFAAAKVETTPQATPPTPPPATP